MSYPSDLYRPPLALLTDLYQLTMAYAAWKSGASRREAIFHLHFRKNPFRGGFALACGLSAAVELIRSFRFAEDDLEYLALLPGPGGRPLFEAAFLRELGKLELRLEVDAVPEGTVVFPQEPLVRVQGPIIPCMLLETPLLTLINFATLVATKAARIALAARGSPVIEFGLRRAQGIDGGLTASRSAFVGGCAGTSNLLAGKLFGIPVKGTHAHSWVMLFEGEREAFETYAAALPDNCLFLVDTYDTLQGVRNAIEVGKALRLRGHELLGVRLDSGDLAWLSAQARRLLDEAGFPGAQVFASNDLDEAIIESLHQQGAAIGVWGVGTRLATAYDDPALGGVYKLSAVREPGGPWRHTLKLSEQAVKISTPGKLNVRRWVQDGQCVGDMIWDELLPPPPAVAPVMVDPLDPTRRKKLPEGASSADLLVPIFRDGKCVYEPPPAAEARALAQAELARFHAGIKRFVNPHIHPVGLERGLHDFKTRLVVETRGVTG
jgi:nicotinate phosphoribosyltransferase